MQVLCVSFCDLLNYSRRGQRTCQLCKRGLACDWTLGFGSRSAGSMGEAVRADWRQGWASFEA